MPQLGIVENVQVTSHGRKIHTHTHMYLVDCWYFYNDDGAHAATPTAPKSCPHCAIPSIVNLKYSIEDGVYRPIYSEYIIVSYRIKLNNKLRSLKYVDYSKVYSRGTLNGESHHVIDNCRPG